MPPPASAVATSAGRSVAIAIGSAAPRRAVTSAQVRPSWPISVVSTIGCSDWSSREPPARTAIAPVSGSRKVPPERPSQNCVGEYWLVIADGAVRRVTWRSRPKVALGAKSPLVSPRTMPSDASTSSAVPKRPSRPG